MKNIPESMIKAMSLENRQKRYNEEKDLLIQKMRGATAGELSDALKALVKKWRV